MKKRAVLLNDIPAKIHYVYSPEQLSTLARLTDLHPGVVTAAELDDQHFQDVEVIFSTWGMPALTPGEIRSKLPNLKAVFYAAGATDSFFDAFDSCGVQIFSAWQANAIPVAEYCTATILLSLKGFFRNAREMKGPDGWAGNSSPGVYGETVVLIGAGAIARKIQEFLTPHNIDLEIIPSRSENLAERIRDAFARACVVSNHLPNRDDNKGIITGEMFRLMREGATFINTGRGAQVEEEAMLDVLAERPDLTAIIDTPIVEPPPPESRLYSLPNVISTSHIAGSMNDEVHRMADYMIEEFQRFEAGEQPLYLVKRSMLLTASTSAASVAH